MYKMFFGFQPRGFSCDCQLDIVSFHLSTYSSKRSIPGDVQGEFQSGSHRSELPDS